MSDQRLQTKKRYYERQIIVQRRNLIQGCRLCVKTLLDKACFDSLDESCEEVINFCASVEQLLNHRIKASPTLFGNGVQRYFWDYIKLACAKLPRNCIKQISNMENLKTSKAKGRAWLRVVLIEKRLSEYFSCAVKEQELLRRFYDTGSVLLSDDISLLSKDFIGLNTMDFSFCVRGANFDIGSIPEIDYSPYLKFQQCSDSIRSDQEEMNNLKNGHSSNTSSLSDVDINDDDDFRHLKIGKLEKMYKTTFEQKGYLEEVVRNKENQVSALSSQKDTLVNLLQQKENESRVEKKQLENVVLELQTELAKEKQERLRERAEFDEYLLQRRLKGPRSASVAEVAMSDMSGIITKNKNSRAGSVSAPGHEEGMWWDENDTLLIKSAGSDSESDMFSSNEHQEMLPQDSGSLLSDTFQDIKTSTLDKDTASMMPLTGSIKSAEESLDSETNQQPENTNEDQSNLRDVINATLTGGATGQEVTSQEVVTEPAEDALNVLNSDDSDAIPDEKDHENLTNSTQDNITVEQSVNHKNNTVEQSGNHENNTVEQTTNTSNNTVQDLKPNNVLHTENLVEDKLKDNPMQSTEQINIMQTDNYTEEHHQNEIAETHTVIADIHNTSTHIDDNEETTSKEMDQESDIKEMN